VQNGEVEVFTGSMLNPRAPTICAAPPADTFGEGTAALLEAASNAQIVCVNPRGIGGSSPVTAGQRYTLEESVDDIESVRHGSVSAGGRSGGCPVAAG